MVRPRSASSEPTWSTHSPAAGLPAPESAEALPVPANHGLGANDVERLPPACPAPREPNPKRAIEAPEPRSLGAVAEQSELLPERQVFEREVSAGSERRAQGAQQGEHEGHCAPCLARRWPIVQTRDRVLGAPGEAWVRRKP